RRGAMARSCRRTGQRAVQGARLPPCRPEQGADETGGLSRAAEQQYTVEDPQEHQGVRESRAVVARGGDEPARSAALLRPFEDLASGVLDRPRRTRFFRERLPGRVPRAVDPELFRTRRDPTLCADRRLQG